MRLIGFAGWSGAGKTTLIVKLIPELNRRGFSVSTIKHAHHNFDLDQPGKDSYEHRAAGAEEVLVASANRVALMRELRGAPEPSLAELLRLFEGVAASELTGEDRSDWPIDRRLSQRIIDGDRDGLEADLDLALESDVPALEVVNGPLLGGDALRVEREGRARGDRALRRSDDPRRQRPRARAPQGAVRRHAAGEGRRPG